MITVKYTLQELQDLTTLLDIAVKQQGLKAAGTAFLLHQKHVVSLEMAKEDPPTDPEPTPPATNGKASKPHLVQVGGNNAVN